MDICAITLFAAHAHSLFELGPLRVLIPVCFQVNHIKLVLEGDQIPSEVKLYTWVPLTRTRAWREPKEPTEEYLAEQAQDEEGDEGDEGDEGEDQEGAGQDEEPGKGAKYRGIYDER